MIEILKALSIPVSSHNHLVKVECHTEGPQEVSKEEIVENHCTRYAHHVVVEVETEEEE